MAHAFVRWLTATAAIAAWGFFPVQAAAQHGHHGGHHGFSFHLGYGHSYYGYGHYPYFGHWGGYYPYYGYGPYGYGYRPSGSVRVQVEPEPGSSWTATMRGLSTTSTDASNGSASRRDATRSPSSSKATGPTG